MAIFSNHIINMCAVSLLLAQLLKPFFGYLRQKEWDWHLLHASGGLPSSHTSTVCTLCVGVGRTEGFASDLFAIVLVFAIIVMYDAMGVRRAAGDHAKIINKMLEDLMKLEFRTESLREVMGHTPIEVFCGLILGVIIGILMPI